MYSWYLWLSIDILVPNDFSCNIELINPAALRCNVITSGATAATDITIRGWTLDGKEIIADDLYVISNNGKQSLMVVKDLRTDTTGSYECVVENNVQLRISCNYTLGEYLFVSFVFLRGRGYIRKYSGIFICKQDII